LGLPNLRMAPLDASVDHVVADSDLVVTYYSLTALEAIALGVPVAMVNLTSKRDLFPELTEILGVTAIRDRSDLTLAITGAAHPSGINTPAPNQLAEFWDRAMKGPHHVEDIVSEATRHAG
jgi:hypothetical protein